MEEHLVQRLVRFAQFQGNQGKFALGAGGVVHLLGICHDVAARADKFFQRVIHGTGAVHYATVGVAMAHLIVQPQVEVLVSTRTGFGVENQQVFRAKAELFRRHGESARAGACLRDKRFVQPLAFFGCLRAALYTGKHVTRTLPADALRQCAQRFRRNGKRQRATRLVFGTMGLVHRPITDRGQKPAIETDIPKQQAMVGNHHIAALRLLARTMHKATAPEERALMA